ncbi:hypothetical protein SynNOUM97013_02466 [Synechococcus sp. NOUM97013]|nr:hypothetical protein SynNOUM97013_02466 [Synechococcus sp. NOUM97013]
MPARQHISRNRSEIKQNVSSITISMNFRLSFGETFGWLCAQL